MSNLKKYSNRIYNFFCIVRSSTGTDILKSFWIKKWNNFVLIIYLNAELNKFNEYVLGIY